MWTLIKNIPLILQWLPVVMTGATIIEALVGGAKDGAEKKAELMAWLRNVGTKLGWVWTDRVVDVLDQLIDLVIDIFNWRGNFQHTRDMPEEEVKAQEAVVMATADVTRKAVAAEAAEDPALAEFIRATAR